MREEHKARERLLLLPFPIVYQLPSFLHFRPATQFMQSLGSDLSVAANWARLIWQSDSLEGWADPARPHMKGHNGAGSTILVKETQRRLAME